MKYEQIEKVERLRKKTYPNTLFLLFRTFIILVIGVTVTMIVRFRLVDAKVDQKTINGIPAMLMLATVAVAMSSFAISACRPVRKYQKKFMQDLWPQLMPESFEAKNIEPNKGYDRTDIQKLLMVSNNAEKYYGDGYIQGEYNGLPLEIARIEFYSFNRTHQDLTDFYSMETTHYIAGTMIRCDVNSKDFFIFPEYGNIRLILGFVPSAPTGNHTFDQLFTCYQEGEPSYLDENIINTILEAQRTTNAFLEIECRAGKLYILMRDQDEKEGIPKHQKITEAKLEEMAERIESLMRIRERFGTVNSFVQNDSPPD